MKIVRAMMVAALPVLGACASGGQATGAGGPERVEVVVENNFTPPTIATIYIAQSGGTRTHLGTVVPLQTRRMRYNTGSIGGHYRLIAEVGNQQVATQLLPLQGGEVVEWQLNSGAAFIRQPR